MSTSPEARPGGAVAEDPERRPAPLADVDLGAHLEPAVLEVVLARRRHRGRRVVVVLAVGLPVAAAGDVVRVQDVDLLRGDGQQAVRHRRVVGLVPLQLLIADEALLVAPVRRIGGAAAVELVGPGEVPGAARGGDLSAAGRRRRACCRAATGAGGVAASAGRRVPAAPPVAVLPPAPPSHGRWRRRLRCRRRRPCCPPAPPVRGVPPGAARRVRLRTPPAGRAAARCAAGRAGAAAPAVPPVRRCRRRRLSCCCPPSRCCRRWRCCRPGRTASVELLPQPAKQAKGAAINNETSARGTRINSLLEGKPAVSAPVRGLSIALAG